MAAPVVQRAVVGTTGARAGRPGLGLGRPLAEFEFVQREVEVPPSPSATPTPTEPIEAVPSIPSIAAFSAFSAAPETGATAGAAGQAAQAGTAGQVAAPGREPEELLKKLYDPLVRRLKAELWLDRERRGALTDRWR
ncbi:hypothetical protein [Saccharothrix deserti]|uniref:hypothetical protein n=1 Tax=Saccharothrix deserti TaxID=2593674 RepID=UPI00131A69B9|nr:hypothetical protein [Saccharothrix deserti]